MERQRGGRRGDRYPRLAHPHLREPHDRRPELGNSALTNHDDKDRIKILIPVSVGYREDLAVVKKVAVDEALEIDGVMRDLLPGVSVVDLGAS